MKRPVQLRTGEIVKLPAPTTWDYGRCSDPDCHLLHVVFYEDAAPLCAVQFSLEHIDDMLAEIEK